MSLEPQPLAGPNEHQRWFATTHWSVVLSARESSPQAAAALEAHNLSLVPDYDDLYIAHLRLRPIRTLSPA